MYEEQDRDLHRTHTNVLIEAERVAKALEDMKNDIDADYLEVCRKLPVL